MDRKKFRWWRVLASTVLLAAVAAIFLTVPVSLERHPVDLPSAERSVALPAALLAEGTFVGIDPETLSNEQRSLISQAATDFARARIGLEPTCKYESMGAFSDGGTTAYECPGYRLTIMKGLFSLAGVNGYLVGPIMTFSEDNSVSDVRFYTHDELARLQSDRDGSN